MNRLSRAWRWLVRSSALLAVLVALPASALATVQCILIRRDLERAEQLTKMMNEQVLSLRRTSAVQSAIADSAERATQATITASDANLRSIAAAERAAAVAERMLPIAERSARAAEASVEIQRQIAASQRTR